METIETLRAERDALQRKNKALMEQATQLIGDLASARSSGGAKADKAPDGAMRRADFDALSPKARMAFALAGGIVVE